MKLSLGHIPDAAVQLHLHAGDQLFSPHGADRAVHQNIPVLDAVFRLSAGLHRAGEFQECLQLDEFRGNRNVLFPPEKRNILHNHADSLLAQVSKGLLA